MDSDDNAEKMRRLFREAWNNGNTDVVDEVVADEFVFSRGDGSDGCGPELYKELIAFAGETFTDMEYTFDDVIVADGGETVVVRWTMTATHAGAYKGVEPTGQRVEMDGVEVNEFENGKLVETWTYPNWVDFLEEVGALPLGD